MKMNLSNAVRRAFNPTPEEELEDLNKYIEIFKRSKKGKHCSTCKNWTPPPEGLPGFVEDHGDCSEGYVVDTVKNCPKYIYSEDCGMDDVIKRRNELKKIIRSGK